ncbi:hypothetical protein FA15DRAFT_669759 [Coprinopsis marcescibilis]|uniref:Cytosolic endo-beta-N-acetylglucosaminidase TIM barrel domain-containing protein n=1 Tax=Coprinopsis marcescibilis TaxID=230819 RepID=A0A5C3KUL4_COPMA|nr:hypothetical protein FA15DRAFT_669759 [Coprinopsis marcescibilis]
MPIAGKKFHPRALPEFWRSFKEFDEWRSSQNSSSDPADGVVKYVPRKQRESDTAGKGKLLVSHDFKGGYVEDPFNKSYSFNWWFVTDIFNYFAHHRISIPPPEWITASHRQGVPILGTIIFEGQSDLDLLRMVVGKLPEGPNSQAVDYTVPVSSYYAELFADIAKERGFDGWLMNVEIYLQGGAAQARGLAAWMSLLTDAIHRKVGPHGQVIWYDSVIIDGNLSWQDRLNAYNLPFFLASDGIFTNYWWRTRFPRWQQDWFASLDPNLTGQTAEPHQHVVKKTLKDIYVGVDVWGRGSHGEGGFGSYKAIEHWDPRTLGFSIALFAQGWTWETEQDKPGWNWEAFWEYDSKLWVGPPTGTVVVPPHILKPGEVPCTHDPYQPLSAFFPNRPPPDPLDLPFFTNFCPGIGNAWRVEGQEVWQSEKGWTDMDKQTSIGDLVWPRPKAYNLTGGTLSNATMTSALNFADAWNGGTSLQLNLTVPGNATKYGGYWVPIQSFTFTSRTKYEASIVYKVGLSGKVQFDATFELGIRTISGDNHSTIISKKTSDLAYEWKKTTVTFEIATPVAGGSTIVPSSVGLVVAVSTPSVSGPFEFPFLVGHIAVYPHLPDQYKEFKTNLLWMTFAPEAAKPLDGILSWEVVTELQQPPPVTIDDPEDTRVPWNLQSTKQDWFPRFLYYNIYAKPVLQGGGFGQSTWIGTTGLDGQTKRFFVYDENLPTTTGQRRFTFEIEGVLDTGDVTRWFDTPAPSVGLDNPKRARRVSLKAMLNPLRRKKSKGDGSLAK